MQSPCTSPKTKPSETETQVSKSDEEIADMPKKLLLNQGLDGKEDQVREILRQQASQDEGPQTVDNLMNLTNQVTEIIPQRRIDTLEGDGHANNPPTEDSGDDLRGFLNEKRGIEEIELTSENLATVSREMQNKSLDEGPQTGDNLAIIPRLITPQRGIDSTEEADHAHN